MKFYPLNDVLENLKKEKVYAIDIIRKWKKGHINLYFRYEGAIGVTNVKEYDNQKDGGILIEKIEQYDDLLSIDINSTKTKEINQIIEFGGNLECWIHTGVKDNLLVFLLKEQEYMEVPIAFGEFFMKGLSKSFILSYEKIYMDQDDFNYLLKLNDEINLEETIDLKLKNRNVESSNSIEDFQDETLIEAEGYLTELIKLNDLYGIKLPDKILIALKAYCYIYIDKNYISKVTKLSHSNMFDKCLMDLQEKYEMNNTFVEELKRFTNPDPQKKVKIKK